MNLHKYRRQSFQFSFLFVFFAVLVGTCTCSIYPLNYTRIFHAKIITRLSKIRAVSHFTSRLNGNSKYSGAKDRCFFFGRSIRNRLFWGGDDEKNDSVAFYIAVRVIAQLYIKRVPTLYVMKFHEIKLSYAIRHTRENSNEALGFIRKRFYSYSLRYFFLFSLDCIAYKIFSRTKFDFRMDYSRLICTI